VSGAWSVRSFERSSRCAVFELRLRLRGIKRMTLDTRERAENIRALGVVIWSRSRSREHPCYGRSGSGPDCFVPGCYILVARIRSDGRAERLSPNAWRGAGAKSRVIYKSYILTITKRYIHYIHYIYHDVSSQILL